MRTRSVIATFLLTICCFGFAGTAHGDTAEKVFCEMLGFSVKDPSVGKAIQEAGAEFQEARKTLKGSFPKVKSLEEASRVSAQRLEQQMADYGSKVYSLVKENGVKRQYKKSFEVLLGKEGSFSEKMFGKVTNYRVFLERLPDTKDVVVGWYREASNSKSAKTLFTGNLNAPIVDAVSHNGVAKGDSAQKRVNYVKLHVCTSKSEPL